MELPDCLVLVGAGGVGPFLAIASFHIPEDVCGAPDKGRGGPGGVVDWLCGPPDGAVGSSDGSPDGAVADGFEDEATEGDFVFRPVVILVERSALDGGGVRSNKASGAPADGEEDDTGTVRKSPGGANVVVVVNGAPDKAVGPARAESGDGDGGGAGDGAGGAGDEGGAGDAVAGTARDEAGA
jgi:hypothetical protein